MVENKERIAHLTSSKIFKLIKVDAKGNFQKPGETYIQEKRMEKRMNRCLDVEKYAKQMAWGHFMELFVHKNHLDIYYEKTATETDRHPTIKGWSGSKDFIVVRKKISELKAYEPKKFGAYTDALLTKDISIIRENFPEEYWQLVSNAMINNVPNAEAITFMPYKSELDEVRKMAENYDDYDQWKYRFIWESEDKALPYLPDGGYYKNLNKFEFEVPKEDKELLTERVNQAIKELNK